MASVSVRVDFFSFWVWISRLGFLMFTFYKAIPEHGRRRRRSCRSRAPPTAVTLYASFSTLNVFFTFYVLCRFRVRFCWFELSFVGGGFHLIHLLSFCRRAAAAVAEGALCVRRCERALGRVAAVAVAAAAAVLSNINYHDTIRDRVLPSCTGLQSTCPG